MPKQTSFSIIGAALALMSVNFAIAALGSTAAQAAEFYMGEPVEKEGMQLTRPLISSPTETRQTARC